MQLAGLAATGSGIRKRRSHRHGRATRARPLTQSVPSAEHSLRVHSMRLGSSRNALDNSVRSRLVLPAGVRFNLVVERSTLRWCPRSGDRVTMCLGNLFDAHCSTSGKIAASQLDQHLGRKVRDRLREGKQARFATTAQPYMPSPDIGPYVPAARLFAGEESCSIRCGEQRRNVVRIKCTKAPRSARSQGRESRRYRWILGHR